MTSPSASRQGPNSPRRSGSAVRWHRSLSVKLALVLGLVVFSIQLLAYVVIVESFRTDLGDLDSTSRTGAAPFAEFLADNVTLDDQGRWLPTPAALRVIEIFLNVGETYVWLDDQDRVLVAGPGMDLYVSAGDPWDLCSSREYCPVDLAIEPQKRAGSSWTALAARGKPIGTFVLIWFEDPQVAFARERQVRLDLYTRLIGAGLLATLTTLLLAGLVTRRLSRLAAEASTPLGDDLNLVDLPGPFDAEGDDEIARLAAALNTMRGRIKDLVARLEERDRQRREWIALVSHDLRTPLTALIVCLDRAQTTLNSTPNLASAASLREAILVARQDGERLQTLVEDLFELARLDANDQLVLEPVPPGELVRQTVRGLQPLAESQGVTLQAVVEPSLPTIQADGRRLMRALENLVRNAAYFGRSKVQVVAQSANGMLKLEVRDDGPGLPMVDGKPVLGAAENQPKRADSAGLGLIVTRRVAEAHGGSLQGANRAEGGAAVWIELPLTRSLANGERSHS